MLCLVAAMLSLEIYFFISHSHSSMYAKIYPFFSPSFTASLLIRLLHVRVPIHLFLKTITLCQRIPGSLQGAHHHHQTAICRVTTNMHKTVLATWRCPRRKGKQIRMELFGSYMSGSRDSNLNMAALLPHFM